jgi:hypothetical protein
MEYDKIKFYKFYGEIGKVYVDSILLPQWKDPKNSDLYVFLKNYAYERQGGNAIYPYVAPELITDWLDGTRNSEEVTKEFENRLEEYKTRTNSDGGGENRSRNPLYDGSKRSTKKSIMTFIDEYKRKSLKEILWIVEGNQWKVDKAYCKLLEINGIGPKIASYYLRDLMEFQSLNVEKINIEEKDRWLLQPIDIWVRRIVEVENKELKKKKDMEIAKEIVSISLENNLNPEHVNMGMWFFGSRIIGNKYEFYSLYKLKNYDEFKDNVKKYSNTLDGQLKSIKTLNL